MVDAIEKAMGEDIQSVARMSADTKAQALVKLHAITNRIGYPDKWRDYSTLQIVRGMPWETRNAPISTTSNAG
jgi:endothelin-converting enzyme/putative endopeptidase